MPGEPTDTRPRNWDVIQSYACMAVIAALGLAILAVIVGSLIHWLT